MGKYDTPHKVTTTASGVFSEAFLKNASRDEIIFYLERQNIYTFFVRCRKCHCSHVVASKCPVCGLPAKIEFKI